MKETNNILVGGFLCIVAYIFLSAMSAISKHLQDLGFSVFHVLFFSFFFTFIFSLPWIFKQGLKTAFKTKFPFIIVSRSVLGFAAFSILFLSVKQIPLVDSLTLFNTAPLWVPFLAFIFLKERFSYKTLLCIVLGFLGIILVIHPRVAAMNFIGDAEALLAGLGASFVIVIMRFLKEEEHQRVVLYYGIISTVISFFFIYNSWKMPEGVEWLLLVGAGICMYSMQMLATQAFHYAKATVLGPLSYSSIIASGVIGLIFWDQVPTLTSIAGMLVVIVSGILILFLGIKEERIKPDMHHHHIP